MAAASTADVSSLVAKLRGKGLTDAQVTEALRGMGYSKAEASAAVGTPAGAPASRRTGRPRGSSPAPEPAGPPAPPAEPPAPATGGGMPSLSLPSFTPTLTPPRKLDGGDVAGFIGGLVLYTLALNYLRYGLPGVKGWLSAKFLNKPYQVTPTGSVAPAVAGRGLTSTKSRKPKNV